jgi:hypothetical protein
MGVVTLKKLYIPVYFTYTYNEQIERIYSISSEAAVPDKNVIITVCNTLGKCRKAL